MKKLLSLILVLAFLPLVNALTISNAEVPNYWITDQTAMILWETDAYATSVVEYGTTTSYGQTINRNGNFRSHVLEFQGLNPSTTYYYRINSNDGTNTATFTGSFTTDNEYSNVVNIPGGYYSSPYIINQGNTKYVLQGDITAETGAISIRADNIILDLNGYTITYDDHTSFPYEIGIPNGGFEEGSGAIPSIWDMSNAPNTVRMSTSIEALFGLWYLQFGERAGEEIVSQYTYLPANTDVRGYFSIGEGWGYDWPSPPSVTYSIEKADGTIVGSQTGDGVPNNFIQFQTGNQIEQYRVRFKMNTYNGTSNKPGIRIDNFDIRPQNIVGIIGDQRTNVVVRNGYIVQGRGKSHLGHALKLANNNMIIQNLNISTFGQDASPIELLYNSNSLAVRNKVSADNPTTIRRANLRGAINFAGTGGLVYDNIAYGGDGQSGIYVGSPGVKVAYNFAHTTSQETNHHAIVTYSSDGTEIYGNEIVGEPGQGIIASGGRITLPDRVVDNWVRDHKIFDNTIRLIGEQRPNAEYGKYSRDGIRLNDYGSDLCYDNWIDGNNIIINGKYNDYYTDPPVDWDDYQQTFVLAGISMACKGQNNIVSNNNIVVNTIDQSGIFGIGMESASYYDTNYINNTITTNQYAFGFAGYPSEFVNGYFEGNTIERVDPNPIGGYRTIKSYRGRQPNNNIFVNTNFIGNANFDPQYVESDDWSAPWQMFIRNFLDLTVMDFQSTPIPAASVRITNAQGVEEFQGFTDANGKINKIELNHKRMYGGAYQTTPDQEINTPHTITITKSGFADYTNTISMSSPQAFNAFLTSTGPGILLHSTMDSLAEIQNPTINTETISPSTLGTVDLVPSPYGGGVQIHGQSGNREEIYYADSNFDFSDLGQDGGRMDFKIKFNEDPHTMPNLYVIKTDSNVDGPYRWFVFEMLGTNSRPWIVFYCTEPGCWTPGGQPTFQIFPPFEWSAWQDVQAGEWHQYTILWRNNGPGDAEMHFFIDGQHCGNLCSDYGGYMTPVNAFNRLEWGQLTAQGSADIDIDEFWSFSRWDHGAPSGTYDETVTWPEKITLLNPDNDDFLQTVYPDFEFVMDSNNGPTTCNVIVLGSTVASVPVVSGQRISIQPSNSLAGGSHDWYVSCYDGALVSETRTFTIDPESVPQCVTGQTGGACSSVIDGVTCNGVNTCVDSRWQCVIPPGGCEQNGVGDLWQFQNGLFGYGGESELCIANYWGEHDLSLNDCVLRTTFSNGLMKDKLIYFDLSQLPPGKVVESATLTLTEKLDGSIAGGLVEIRQLITDRSLTDATFNCAEDLNHDGACDMTWIQTGARSDYSNTVSEIMSNGETVGFNVTNMVTEWYENGNNYGFVVKEMEGKLVTLVNASDSPSNLRPLLTIQLSGGSGGGGTGGTFVFDIDGNSIVDILDLYELINNFGSTSTVGNYVASRDYNSDGRINILDLAIHIRNWT